MKKEFIIKDEQVKKEIKDMSDLLQRKMDEFISDMRDLDQTEISACGPGYTLNLKIDRKEPN